MNGYNKRYQVIEMYGLLAIDIVVITISYFVAYNLRFLRGMEEFWGTNSVFSQMLLCAYCICLCFNILLDGYHEFFKRGYFQEFLFNLKFSVILFLLTSACVYVFRLEEDFSRLMLGYFVCINFVLDYLVKISFKQFMLKIFKRSKDSDKILVVTEQEELNTVIEHLEKDRSWSYEIIGIALTDAKRVGEQIGKYKIIAGMEDIIEISRQLPLDVVFIDCPKSKNDEIEELVQSFLAMGCVCHYRKEVLGLDGVKKSYGNFASFGVLTYTVNTFDYRKRLLKKIMDFVGGFIGSCITILLYPFIALCIKLDSPGPVIYKQIRIGKNGRRFQMYKFRSMYQNADEKKDALEEKNEVSGLMFKMECDPRVTKVGAFLRKTSLDELPQFFNVLKGDMSLVGTRPPTEDEFEQYNVYYRRRLSMTPGLTGLWQVSGRSNIKDFDNVVKLDLEYIDNWSLTGDIKILIQTIGVVVLGIGSK